MRAVGDGYGVAKSAFSTLWRSLARQTSSWGVLFGTCLLVRIGDSYWSSALGLGWGFVVDCALLALSFWALGAAYRSMLAQEARQWALTAGIALYVSFEIVLSAAYYIVVMIAAVAIVETLYPGKAGLPPDWAIGLMLLGMVFGNVLTFRIVFWPISAAIGHRLSLRDIWARTRGAFWPFVVGYALAVVPFLFLAGLVMTKTVGQSPSFGWLVAEAAMNSIVAMATVSLYAMIYRQLVVRSG